MKLLIADDEKLTREGLCGSIDWASIGITQVISADDGINGIETAKEFMPDIVLSDVRMPRMNGIDMCEALQRMNPDLRIVFMSGYSDKEYLKSAIRLKAVSYVEKPIDEDEVTEAVREAVRLASEAISARETKQKSRKRELQILAEKLCQPGRAAQAEIDTYLKVDDGKNCAFSLLIKIYHQSLPSSSVLAYLSEIVQTAAAHHFMECIGCDRQNGVYVFHMYQLSDYSDRQKQILGSEISNELTKHTMHFHIVFGKNVKGIPELYHSYNSAVIELQKCFFSRKREVRIYHHTDGYNTFHGLPEREDVREFRRILIGGDASAIHSYLENSLMRILSYRDILPNQVKDLYYRSFHAVSETETVLGMKNTADTADESTWGMISACESVYELDEQLRKRVDRFLEKMGKRSETNAAVAMIREYIANSYTNELLSIKDISDHVQRSASYVCTLFKNETGQTLNQYITDFRIARAKELLLNPGNRIGDISKEVGYADANYFGKMFKKQVGMTPSEYREMTIGRGSF